MPINIWQIWCSRPCPTTTVVIRWKLTDPSSKKSLKHLYSLTIKVRDLPFERMLTPSPLAHPLTPNFAKEGRYQREGLLPRRLHWLILCDSLQFSEFQYLTNKKYKNNICTLPGHARTWSDDMRRRQEMGCHGSKTSYNWQREQMLDDGEEKNKFNTRHW